MRLGDYELIERIGEGGMGEVWRAENVHTRVAYAVKLLPVVATADPGFVKRFFDEGRLMAELEHPGIVRVHHVGHDESSGRYYLVMDLVRDAAGRSVSLHDALAAAPEGRLPETRVRELALQIAEALAFAHGKGVVHRDIKPANVMIDAAGHARLTDFGLAKALGGEFMRTQIHQSIHASMSDRSINSMRTRRPGGPGSIRTGGAADTEVGPSSGPDPIRPAAGAERSVNSMDTLERADGHGSSSESLIGTYDYMSPEARGELSGVEVGPRADVYSFGVMLYRMLTGRRPAGMAEPPSEFIPGLPTAWDFLVCGCLKYKPRERFKDGKRLLAAIRRGKGPASTTLCDQESIRRPLVVPRMFRFVVEAMVLAAFVWAAREYVWKPYEASMARWNKETAMVEPEQKSNAPITAGEESLHQPSRMAAVFSGVFKDTRKAVGTALAGHKSSIGLGQTAIRSGPTEGQDWISPETGMEFVWIPALKIWVGKYEATNGEYRKKVPDHDSEDYEGKSLNGDRQPVVQVNFDDAKAFAEWMTQRDRAVGALPAGCRYRLPSEQEWQIFAQCGVDRMYPWGNTMPPRSGNYSDSPAYDVRDGYRDGFPVSCPVEQSGKNEWGLYGVGGNVWEFAASDKLDESFGAWRGASWGTCGPADLQCSFRIGGGGLGRVSNLGFRLVLSHGGHSDESRQVLRAL